MPLNHLQGETNEELTPYKKRTLELKTQRNTYAYISRLPPEILLRIFKLLQKVHHIPYVNVWHHVTHVCRHWRWIALGDPTLWTYPPTRLKDYTLLMLDRSKTAPLQICLERRASELATAAIFDHLWRIRLLQIRQSAKTFIRTEEILLASTQVASALEHLEVSNPNANKQITLPPAPFRQSKSLYHLELAHVSFEWDIFPLPNLTVLSLYMSSSTTTSLAQILSALTGTPSLEFLYLEMELIIEDAPTRPDIVGLPHLRRLALLKFEASQLCHLMSNLSVPALTSLSVDIDPQAANIVGYRGALSHISSTIDRGSFPTLDLLELSVFSGEFTLLSRHERLSDINYVAIELLSPSDASIDNHGIIKRFMDGMSSIAQHNFEVLTHISIDADLDSKELVELFGSLPNLLALMVISEYTILASIRALKATTGTSQNTVIAFPRLFCIGWSKFQWEDYGYNKLLDSRNSFTYRYNSGAGIKRLYLSQCSKLPDEIAEALEKIGVRIRIDSDVNSTHDGWIVHDTTENIDLGQE